MKINYNDGGRAEAGYKGSAGDCVVRAIAIATEQSYQNVYNDLWKLNKNQRGKLRGKSPRDGGTKMGTIKRYMDSIGWKWTPTMLIGQGCKTHLRVEELPDGKIVVRVARHLTAVIDGVINDTHDCSRGGTRCVYGYWSKL